MNTWMTSVAFLAFLLTMICDTAAQSIYTLIPRPRMAFERAGSFRVTSTTPIVVPNNASAGFMRSVTWLRLRLMERLGAQPPIIDAVDYQPGTSAILVGLYAKNTTDTHPFFIEAYSARTPRFEWHLQNRDEYVLDVDDSLIVLAAADTAGLFNGAATITDLVRIDGSIGGVHIHDYPDIPTRWVFSQHNLRGNGAITTLRGLADTMAACKLNGLQQNDFKYSILSEQPAHYFDSARALESLTRERNIALIPGVAPIGWSAGLLWRDPNLAEGFPATADYIATSDTARIVPDDRVTLPNGGFESVDGNERFTGWSFYDDNAAIDRTVYRSGSASARCENFTAQNSAGNSRFSRRLECRPYRHYLMTAWVRAQNLSADEVRLLAIGIDSSGQTHPLTFTAFSIPATTTDWTRLEVRFNTLHYTSMQVYAGVWGGKGGVIWWDDVAIVDAGLANILRRKGTPLHVRGSDNGTEYIEGVDFATVVDSLMLAGRGDYGPYHAPPALRRLPSGRISEGERLAVSFFHPLTTVADRNGNGSVMVCVSEEKLYDLLRDQISDVGNIYWQQNPKRFFLGHDEIRSLNRDSSCLRREMSAAGILADNLSRCIELVDSISPGAETYVWSDMFDSLHNAVPDYYLVRGDLSGDWDLLRRKPIIVNWNGGKKEASMDFFRRHGFTQITSPYYDSRDTRNIRAWRIAMERRPTVTGMMYTTWSSDYSQLRPFSYYAWCAGPFLVHAPLDTSIHAAIRAGDSITIPADILPDPYDPTDSISEASFTFISGSTIERIPMRRDSGHRWIARVLFPHNVVLYGMRYTIMTSNTQGIDRETPDYEVGTFIDIHDVPSEPERRALTIIPNPTPEKTTVQFTLSRSGAWELGIVDALGRLIRTRRGVGVRNELQQVEIDFDGIPSGYYRCFVRAGRTWSGVPVVLRR